MHISSPILLASIDWNLVCGVLLVIGTGLLVIGTGWLIYLTQRKPPKKRPTGEPTPEPAKAPAKKQVSELAEAPPTQQVSEPAGPPAQQANAPPAGDGTANGNTNGTANGNGNGGTNGNANGNGKGNGNQNGKRNGAKNGGKRRPKLLVIFITDRAGKPLDALVCYSPKGEGPNSVSPSGYVTVPWAWGGVSIRNSRTQQEIKHESFPPKPPQSHLRVFVNTQPPEA